MPTWACGRRRLVFAHDNGRKAIEKEFGDKVVTSFVESVPESADAERVRDPAGQGNKLIFGTTFGYMESIQKIAGDLKDVKFEHATGYKTAPRTCAPTTAAPMKAPTWPA